MGNKSTEKNKYQATQSVTQFIKLWSVIQLMSQAVGLICKLVDTQSHWVIQFISQSVNQPVGQSSSLSTFSHPVSQLYGQSVGEIVR